jgi:rSAM/selenodomain-associated transferase 2
MLSVIIPTWQEAACIADAVRAASAIADEVIVVDANSPDATARVARGAGARVVVSTKGRGQQLHVGALEARGDVLLFLHADARLPASARAAIDRALADPQIAGGNFHLRFVPDSPAARLFTWGNHLRRRWLRVYYGDSALFVTRAAYQALGGFRPLLIMEDYEFIRRLERERRTRYIHDIDVRVDARRFAERPTFTLLTWTLIQTLYSAGISAERLAPLYRDLRARSAAKRAINRTARTTAPE